MRAGISPAGISPDCARRCRARKSAALMLQLLGLAAMVGGAFAGSPGHRSGRHGRGLWRPGRRDAQPARLPAGRGVLGRPGRHHLPQRHQAIRQGNAGELPGARRQADRRPGHQSLSAKPSSAAAAHRATPRACHLEPLLRQCRSARAAIPARSDEGQAVRLPRRAEDGVLPLSRDRSELAGDVCAGDRHLSPVRHEGGSSRRSMR